MHDNQTKKHAGCPKYKQPMPDVSRIIILCGQWNLFYMNDAAVINLVLNFILIPPYASEGAAAATLAAEIGV